MAIITFFLFNLDFQQLLQQRGWTIGKMNILFQAFEKVIPVQFDESLLKSTFQQLSWSTEEINEFVSVLESLIPDDFVEPVNESLNASSDFEGWTLHDVAAAALYANVELNVPGYERPNESNVYTATTSKFREHLKRYLPRGWSSYDFIDISEELTELFRVDDAANENIDQHQKNESVRRKLNFD